MNKASAVGRFALILSVLTFAGIARADLITFTPESDDPNDTATANTGAYGSTAIVSVGYSGYSYTDYPDYGTLDGGTGTGVYSDNDTSTFVMTFTAAAGHTVTLDSFSLATWDGLTGEYGTVDISVTGGTSSYTMDNAMPSPMTYTTYSPDVTGSSLTLTISNLYDVGINSIEFSSSSAVPEPSSVVLAAIGGGVSLIGVALRRRKQTA